MAGTVKTVAQEQREQKIVDRCLRGFAEKQAYRSMFGLQWEQAASVAMPDMRNTFFVGNYNFPGIQKTQLQVDATAMLANMKFAAILDSMMTPFSSQWHELEADNPYVQRDRNVRLYFEQVSKIISNIRYRPFSGFRRQSNSIYQMVGALGNGPMFVDQMTDAFGNPIPGIRYKAVPLGEVFVGENHQGVIDCFDRFFRMTARQAVQKWKDAAPEELKRAAERGSEAPFDFLHCVYVNDEYEYGRADHRGMNYKSVYISMTGKKLLEEGGYRSFPLAMCRYTQGPGEIYGRGPAMAVLPSLKTLNAQKTTFLKQAHRAADPVYLSRDDGSVGFSARPGAMNPGYMTEDGKRLVDILPTGEINMSEKAMEYEQAIVKEAFLTTIFDGLVANPNMTATQVVELINQKGVFLAPAAGSMAPEYLGALIDREIDLAASFGVLPPKPPLLREAAGEYKVVYTSPLFKTARAGDAAGFLRTVESAMNVAGQMQDPSVLDMFDFDAAYSDIARIQGVPESWMSSDDVIAQKRQARAESQQRQEQIQSAPAQVALLKAQTQLRQLGGQVGQQ